jgi:hypothetical protein
LREAAEQSTLLMALELAVKAELHQRFEKRKSSKLNAYCHHCLSPFARFQLIVSSLAAQSKFGKQMRQLLSMLVEKPIAVLEAENKKRNGPAKKSFTDGIINTF